MNEGIVDQPAVPKSGSRQQLHEPAHPPMPITK
jgi:hypothetical protein